MREWINGERSAHLLRRLENDEVAAREVWPAAIQPSCCTPAEPDALYPWIFSPNVASVLPEQLREVALLCKCADEQQATFANDAPTRAHAQYVAALQFEFCAAVGALLPGNRSIWDTLRAELSACYWSLLEGVRPMSAQADALSRDAADVMKIARGCGTTARIAARVLHALDCSDPSSLLDSIDAFFTARTLLDSLRTWQSDLERRRITPLTIHLREEDAPNLLDAVFGRLAEPLLEQALAQCELARLHAGGALLRGTWGEMIEELRVYLESIMNDVRAIASVPA